MKFLVLNVLLALVVVVTVVECSVRVKRQACRIGNGGCEQGCRMRRGKRECYCTRGYVLNRDRTSCSDIDECKAGFCKGTCTNTNGSFKCSCPGGSVLLSDGRSCGQTLISCAVNNGECEQVCLKKKPGASTCGCSQGYTLGEDERSCVDIDECASGTHSCNGVNLVCVNTHGTFVCDVPETTPSCNIDNGGCEHECIQGSRGIICACQQNFELESDGKSCVKTEAPVAKPDPCAQNNGGCDHICSNNNGVADCECNSGFVFENGICREQTMTLFSGCGVNVNKSLNVRVVGGSPAGLNSWPWMAALLDNPTNTHFCGGSLITMRHVLTAAHCIKTRRLTDYKVRLGEYDLSTSNETDHIDTNVEDVKVHKKFNSLDLENDIAILRIESFSSITTLVWPVCLPLPNDDFVDQPGYITGWGSIRFAGSGSNVLLEAVVPVWNHSACVAAFPNFNIAETMMCAGLRSGESDSCGGDSGGPFVVHSVPQKQWQIAGIVSWGIKCGAPNRPGIYTRVNRYLDWIIQNTLLATPGVRS